MKLALTAALLVLLSVTLTGSSEPKSMPVTSPEARTPTVNSQIDYAGFVSLAANLADSRESHRVSIEMFLKMAQTPGTIILDTRSESAYAAVHLRGAIHLNFSDFTQEKLAKVIPDRNTRILIYCNNNFKPSGLVAGAQPHTPVAAILPFIEPKSPALALNIPTFVNLRGYGYDNVYELADILSIDDPRIQLAGTEVKNSQP